MAERINRLKAIIFDWDGVFNAGIKNDEHGSPFSEIDSMGVNMFRFSHWLTHNEVLPAFIITGVTNGAAVQLAKREHFNGVFLNCKHKREAFNIISNKYGFESDQIAFVYDDILDLDLCGICGLRICVRRNSSPLFMDYVVRNNLADYITGNTGANQAVREITELLIGINENFDVTIQERMAFSTNYQNYLAQRDAISFSLNQ